MQTSKGSAFVGRPGSPLTLASLTLLLVTAGFLLSGCLGPNDPDPTGNAPIGSIDSAVASGTAIRITGWAIDPNTANPVYVTMSHLSVGTKHLANLPRPDVAKAYPKHGPNHGFDITTPSSGTHARLGEVCLWVENVGAGKQDRILGCREVKLRSDDAIGRFDSIAALNPQRIRIAGWALDPETTGPVNIRYSLDGGSPVQVIANRPRPDVNKVVGIAGDHGFLVDIPIKTGSRTVCVTVVGVGRGKGANLGCKTVLTESVTAVGAGADLQSVQIVGPLSGHPLEKTDRDAGVSTILSDGSVLWLFGDTSGWNPDGTIKYFINNTAAWAPKTKPTATTDGVAPGEQPHQFVLPVAPFTKPCPANWKSAMWPMSAVTVPMGDKDRVVAFMGNVCMGGEWEMQSRGVSVVDWTYDPRLPPSSQPIVGAVRNQNLFGAGDEYGTAAHFDGEYIKAYKCARPADDGLPHWPNDPGYSGCYLARVLPQDVATRGAWKFWSTDSTWSDQYRLAAPMVVPGMPDAGGQPGDKQMPVAAFSIHKDQQSDKFLMTYSPWPGLTNEVFIRSAESEAGPWSKPTKYLLPGCFDSARGEERLCYAATAQPVLSTTSSIGIGYFDQLIALDPPRGGYLAGTFRR